MANLTRLRRNDMRRPFAGGNRAVVAVFASIGGFGMVKGHNQRQPGRVRMTGCAGLAGHRVRRGFYRAGTDAIVAARCITRCRGLAMVKRAN